MRLLLLACAILAAVAITATARAQPGDTGGPEQSAPTASQTRTVRPPEGSLRRGPLPVPEWAVYAAGGAILLVAGGLLARRLSRRSS